MRISVQVHKWVDGKGQVSDSQRTRCVKHSVACCSGGYTSVFNVPFLCTVCQSVIGLQSHNALAIGLTFSQRPNPLSSRPSKSTLLELEGFQTVLSFAKWFAPCTLASYGTSTVPVYELHAKFVPYFDAAFSSHQSN